MKETTCMRTGARVLLVDDEPSDLMIAKMASKRTKVIRDLKVFSDPVQALKFLQESEDWLPHLIISDLNMPRLNGFELLEELKKDSRLKAIPVVVLSTSSDPRDVRKSYELSANSYVTKPTGFPEFMKAWGGIEQFWLKLTQNPIP